MYVYIYAYFLPIAVQVPGNSHLNNFSTSLKKIATIFQLFFIKVYLCFLRVSETNEVPIINHIYIYRSSSILKPKTFKKNGKN